jgi:hypothetical protein
MARKKLLTESEIRRFMKLANVAPVGNKRLSEMYDAPGTRDEEEKEPAMRDMMEQEEEEMDMEMDMEEPMGDELPAEMPEEPMGDEEMDMDMDMDMGMGAEGDMISISDFMSALEDALESVTGQDVSSEIGMDDEMGAPPEGGDVEDLSAEMPPMDDEEMGDEEDMLAERIARRVRARLRAERKAADALKESKMRKVKAKMKRERMANDLTERIFTRLTTK